VDLNFSGQNGLNKYLNGNHAVFQILQRQARENNWRHYDHWSENYNWIRACAPQAFETGTRSGFKNIESNVFKPIASKARQLRAWNPVV
jgi:hypothetical protein